MIDLPLMIPSRVKVQTIAKTCGNPRAGFEVTVGLRCANPTYPD